MSIVLSTVIVALYIFLTYFGATVFSAKVEVSMIVALCAGVTLAMSIVSLFWTPEKAISTSSIAIYSLLIVTLGLLILNTGGITSPFLPLWIGASFLAGMFGLWGTLGMLGLATAYILISFLVQKTTKDVLLAGILAGELPVLLSYLLWRGRGGHESNRHANISTLNRNLEKANTKAETVIESIGDGVIVVNATGAIQLINPAAEAMTGWSANDAVGISYESVLKMEDAKGNRLQNTTDPIAQALNTNQPLRNNDIIVVTKAGKHITAAFSISPNGDSGEGAIAVFRDVTKERAEEHQQAEFISTASHEMRTPVASIEGYLGLALNPNTATIDEKARDFINKAHESAQHLGRLFQDLLDVSKADDGRLSNTPKVVDCVSFTRDIVEGLLPKAQEKNIEVIYRPDGTKATVGTIVVAPVLYVHVDKDHLREVLSNLVENAIKYTLHGQVSIDITGDENYVRFSVKDSGIGIPAEDIGHLFQKFYRVDNSDTREIGGTGLGLYLSRRLVEAMEGRIWVESEYKKGSTFFVELPRVDHTKAQDLLVEEEKAAERDAAAKTTQQSPVVEVPTPAETAVPPVVQPATPAPLPQAPSVQLPPVQPQVVTPPVTPAQTPDTVPSQPLGAVDYTPAPARPVAPVVAVPSRENTPLANLERNPERYTIQTRPQTPTSQNQQNNT